MANEFTVTIRGLRSLDDLESLPRQTAQIASRAINQILRNSRTQSSRLLRQQVNFPARYLVSQDGKIALRPASAGRLEGRLSASSDPRSLARFVSGSARGKGKVKVEVAPGGVRSLPGAFLLSVSGRAGGENTLLAVRSPTKPTGAFRPRKIGKNLWSLYGPSVSQALLHRDERQGIWVEIEDDVASALEREFLRQMKVEGL